MSTAEMSASIDAFERVISYLVIERQHLRASGAGRVELEANRRAIVAMQMSLSRALGQQRASRGG